MPVGNDRTLRRVSMGHSFSFSLINAFVNQPLFLVNRLKTWFDWVWSELKFMCPAGFILCVEVVKSFCDFHWIYY